MHLPLLSRVCVRSLMRPAFYFAITLAGLLGGSHHASAQEADAAAIRVGIVGLDTSHVIAFTKIFNDPNAKGDLAKAEIVAGYPGGTDLPASRDRVEGFTEQLRQRGIEIVDTIPELMKKVDVVLLESVDGRIHLEEATQIINAGKPLFIDKPVAGSLVDATAIYSLAKKSGVPVWSSSSVRFAKTFTGLKNNDKIGDVIGCTTWGPCKYQAGTPDMYFYGLHGIEGLFAVMGSGCKTVTRVTTDGADLLVGVWKGGRIGTYRGIRDGNSQFGLTVFGSKGIATEHGASAYGELCGAIATFFRTGIPPVSAEETLEIFAFMDAADESKRQGGSPVELASVANTARLAATKLLADKETATDE